METTTNGDNGLADRLRQWRYGLGLTREQAAVRIGVASSTLKRWETIGEHNVKPGAGGMALLERAGVLVKGDV